MLPEPNREGRQTVWHRRLPTGVAVCFSAAAGAAECRGVRPSGQVGRRVGGRAAAVARAPGRDPGSACARPSIGGRRDVPAGLRVHRVADVGDDERDHVRTRRREGACQRVRAVAEPLGDRPPAQPWRPRRPENDTTSWPHADMVEWRSTGGQAVARSCRRVAGWPGGRRGRLPWWETARAVRGAACFVRDLQTGYWTELRATLRAAAHQASWSSRVLAYPGAAASSGRPSSHVAR